MNVNNCNMHLKEVTSVAQTKKKKRRKRKKRAKKSGDEGCDSSNHPAKIDTSAPILISSNQVFQQQKNTRKKRRFSEDLEDISSISAHRSTEETRPKYSFQVDDTDHCETPLQAYRDMLDILDRIAINLNKKRSTLRIYDPYYCDGGIKKKLESFGYTFVINRNRDFYHDIDKQTIPEYDVLVTNPPYSGVHIEKLLSFCSVTSRRIQKPFLILLPHFVYTKDYYERALSSTVSSSVFFLIPEVRYAYIPPVWVEAKIGSKALEVGKMTTAPFPSFWYCYAPKEIIFPNWLVQNFGPSGIIRPKHPSGLRYAKCPQDIPKNFKGEFDPSKKRSNPKARKRAAKKRREAAIKVAT